MGSCPSLPTHAAHTTQTNDSSFHPNQPPTQLPPPIHHQHAQINHQPVQTSSMQYQNSNLKWPLPPHDVWSPFQLTDHGPNRYLLRPMSPRPITAKVPVPIATTDEPYNQRDTSNNDLGSMVDSKIFTSGHVQSQLTGRSHGCFNLAASDRIDVAMENLKQTQKDLDERLNNRLKKVSAKAEAKLGLVIADTKQDHEDLLAYDKERQTHHDRLYHDWLQKYIVELNKWRSIELTNLQAELLKYQQKIVDRSKKNIDAINDETNSLKKDILDEEQDSVGRKNKSLTDRIYDITREDAQHLGSEWKTDLNLRVQANVGRIAPGFSCANDPVQQNLP